MRSAIEMGYRLIDTAEMYGEGGAEEVLGQAVAEALRAGDVRREELFIVSKVYPHNAEPQGHARGLRAQPGAAGTGPHRPLSAALARRASAGRDLRRRCARWSAQGRIGHWGVSNFDTDDMEELAAVCGEPLDCAANQVYYSVSERGPEFGLLPWQRAAGHAADGLQPDRPGRAGARDAGSGEDGAAAGRDARRSSRWPGSWRSPAWWRSRRRCAKPHLRDNLAAAEVALSAADLAEIDRLHPPPRRKRPLAMV